MWVRFIIIKVNTWTNTRIYVFHEGIYDQNCILLKQPVVQQLHFVFERYFGSHTTSQLNKYNFKLLLCRFSHTGRKASTVTACQSELSRTQVINSCCSHNLVILDLYHMTYPSCIIKTNSYFYLKFKAWEHLPSSIVVQEVLTQVHAPYQVQLRVFTLTNWLTSI